MSDDVIFCATNYNSSEILKKTITLEILKQCS